MVVTGTSATPASVAAATGFPSEQHHLLSDIFVQSIARQMSRPDQNLNSISWKRLHLSRAKLKASSRTSALLSGFAMVAMVECNLSDMKQPLPFPLLIAFAVCTILLVSVHMLALMISTCILPNIEAVASMQGLVPVSDSPHDKLAFYVEISWIFSTLFGILLFMLEIAILCWVKFWDIRGAEDTQSHGSQEDGRIAALIATILLVPIVVIFIGFAAHFYRRLVTHQYEARAKGLEELQSMVCQLDLESENNAKAVSGDGNQRTTTSANDFNSSSIIIA